MAAASDFARRHGTLATILGGVLSASVLTAVAVTHKDTALARTREELGVSIARAEGHMDAKILDLLMHGDYAKAREQLLEIKGRVRAGGSDSTAP